MKKIQHTKILTVGKNVEQPEHVLILLLVAVSTGTIKHCGPIYYLGIFTKTEHTNSLSHSSWYHKYLPKRTA